MMTEIEEQVELPTDPSPRSSQHSQQNPKTEEQSLIEEQAATLYHHSTTREKKNINFAANEENLDTGNMAFDEAGGMIF